MTFNELGVHWDRQFTREAIGPRVFREKNALQALNLAQRRLALHVGVNPVFEGRRLGRS